MTEKLGINNQASDKTYSIQISRWGRLTVGLGLLLSLAGPVYLFTVEGLWPGWSPILTAFIAVAVIFGGAWLIEPPMYFPMLGVSGTYQAYLVGNISNKLLPASIAAQAANGAKPGTKRAEMIAVAAIAGAVIVHVISMILLVAVLGHWIISVLPEAVRNSFDFILPALIGAVFVQLIFMLKEPVVTAVAVVSGGLGVFVVGALVPSVAEFVLPVVVLITVGAAMFVGSRRHDEDGQAENQDEGTPDGSAEAGDIGEPLNA